MLILATATSCTGATAPNPCIPNAVHVILKPGETLCVVVTYR